MLKYGSCGSINIGRNSTLTISGYSDINGTVQCLSSHRDLSSFSKTSCYCIPLNGASCRRYNLRFDSSTCDDLRGLYTTRLTASTAFCSINFLFGLVLSLLSCAILCKSAEIRIPEAIGHLKWLRDDDTDNQSGTNNTNMNGDDFDRKENYKTYENNYLEYDHPRANVAILPLNYVRQEKFRANLVVFQMGAAEIEEESFAECVGFDQQIKKHHQSYSHSDNYPFITLS